MMKTDRLIDILSRNIEPVEPGRIDRTLAWAIVIGGIGAFCVMLATVSVRTDMVNGYLALKLLFALSVIGVGATWLMRLIRPGHDNRIPLALLLPFVVLCVAGIGAPIFGGSMTRDNVIHGTHWALCLVCIPLFAIPAFAALIWALRQGAPTHLTRTGAIAGLVAGALGAVAYAFYCPDDSLPFVAVWYTVPLAFTAFLGAMLGPRLLRW